MSKSTPSLATALTKMATFHVVITQQTPSLFVFRAWFSLLRKPFSCFGRLGNGERGIKRAGAGEKGNKSARGILGRKKGEKSRPRTPPIVQFARFALFPRFFAISPLKKPLRRKVRGFR